MLFAVSAMIPPPLVTLLPSSNWPVEVSVTLFAPLAEITPVLFMLPSPTFTIDTGPPVAVIAESVTASASLMKIPPEPALADIVPAAVTIGAPDVPTDCAEVTPRFNVLAVSVPPVRVIVPSVPAFSVIVPPGALTSPPIVRESVAAFVALI